MSFHEMQMCEKSEYKLTTGLRPDILDNRREREDWHQLEEESSIHLGDTRHVPPPPD